MGDVSRTFVDEQRLDNLRRKSSAQRDGNSRVSVRLCNDSASNIAGSAIVLRIRTTPMSLERHDASLHLPEASWELLPHRGQPSGVHSLQLGACAIRLHRQSIADAAQECREFSCGCILTSARWYNTASTNRRHPRRHWSSGPP